ncbi:MAG: leucyl aminopeptidase family protein, partial [Alphaproteobacteria bacterium]
QQHGAKFRVIVGEQLLRRNFPLIHAVGRASDREPRLIDFTWGRPKDPKITLVGKGITFDTGGLSLKPTSSMLLMKKDMGGAAAVLALASMIMAAKLRVRLRVLIAAADNAVSASAFRPGDVLPSRNGMTVEIGNTDAEGRLVVADALALADEEKPDHLISMATLTGAARVALGPDLPPLYSTDDGFAEQTLEAGLRVGDPLWRMPFWQPYDQRLRARVADVNHISDGPFAGSLTAAMFLKRFVRNAGQYSHFDIFGWVPVAKPAFPEGGDPQGARALFEVFDAMYGA